MYRIIGCLLCGLVVLAGSLHAQSGPIRVACIGNSITYGGLGAQSYPQQLGAMLGSHYTVRNFGVSGTTMLRKGDYPYWNEQSFFDAQDFDPQIVIICLGTNDSKPWNWTYGADYYGDYTDFVATFRAGGRHPQVFVCFPPPVFRDGYGITNAVIRDEIIPLVDSVRQVSHTCLIDYYTAMRGDSLLFPDGIHPNAAGYTHMAQLAYDAIVNSPPGFVRIFVTEPDTVEQGESALLSWETTAGSSVTLNGAVVGGTDSAVVSPAAATTYTLIAQGPEYADTSRLEVSYLPPGLVREFTVTPIMLDEGVGDSCLLRWRASKGSAVRLDGVPVGPDSSAYRTPWVTTTYTLVAEGEVVDTATLTVQVLPPGQINRALYHTAKASTTERGYAPASAVDGDTMTVWKSAASLFQWIYVDLGATYTVERVVIHWGPFYGTTYHIQALDSSGASTNVFSTTAGDGGTDDVSGFNRNARYVRILSTARNTPDSGYVISELEVYGRRPSSTAVEEPVAIPRIYALEQNYPNPFNGETHIGVQLPEDVPVSLRLYDILGREVAVLVDGQMPAGRHTVRLDATRLASGVYEYRLQAGPYAATRRLMLLR